MQREKYGPPRTGVQHLVQLLHVGSADHPVETPGQRRLQQYQLPISGGQDLGSVPGPLLEILPHQAIVIVVSRQRADRRPDGCKIFGQTLIGSSAGVLAQVAGRQHQVWLPGGNRG